MRSVSLQSDIANWPGMNNIAFFADFLQCDGSLNSHIGIHETLRHSTFIIIHTFFNLETCFFSCRLAIVLLLMRVGSGPSFIHTGI